MWRCLTVGFTLRSEQAVEAGARGTGQALCVGALLLPCLLSSLLQSHDAPAALSAIDQSGCRRGATAQWGYIKESKWWEAQGLMLAHNRLSHERKRQWEKERNSKRWDVCLKKKKPDQMHSFLQRALTEQNISFSSPNQYYASLTSNNQSIFFLFFPCFPLSCFF